MSDRFVEVHWANGNDFCFVSGHDNFLRSTDVFKKPDRLFVDAIVQIFLVHDKRFIVGENELSVDICFVDLMTLIMHDKCFLNGCFYTTKTGRLFQRPALVIV